MKNDSRHRIPSSNLLDGVATIDSHLQIVSEPKYSDSHEVQHAIFLPRSLTLLKGMVVRVSSACLHHLREVFILTVWCGQHQRLKENVRCTNFL